MVRKLTYGEHLKAIQGTTFKKFFLGFGIIDKGKHYRTRWNNYIDILAKRRRIRFA